MYIRTRLIPSKRPLRWQHAKIYDLKCDQCGVEFEKRYCSEDLIKRQMHFCSKACKHAAQNITGALNKKIVKTCKEKFGVSNPFQDPRVKQKIRETHQQKYGVDHSSQNDIVKQKFTQTCIKHFGVEAPMMSEEIRQKSRETCLEKYGVENVAQVSEIQIKMLNTAKIRGTTQKSKIEDDVYEKLTSHFGHDDIVRWVRINPHRNWKIDFYIKSLDVYIEVDGEYWHGLDRPLNEIACSASKRDKKILNCFHSDREKDQWAKDNYKILIRITDKQVSSNLDIKQFIADNVKRQRFDCKN